MNADDIHSLLICPFCNNPLSDPTTLRCGHSLCLNHVRNLDCPLIHDNISSSPSSSSSSRPSNVEFIPAPSFHQHSPLFQRADVTLNSIATLCTSSPRPRKRRRREPDTDNDDLLSHLRSQSAIQRTTRPEQPLDHDPHTSSFQKDLRAELTCKICFMLLYQPVTTPCQHTFCEKCLHRSLDHSDACPLCRQDLPGYAYFQDHPYNSLILSILLKAFPDEYKQRGATLEADERDARLNTPIFVCQLSFPGMPTLLHFFEPRYRLMLRRCLESRNPCFGMIMPPRAGTSSLAGDMQYGTMLEIRSVQMLSDGRSMVETWGTWRFRIIERGSLDGYTVGRVERIDDIEEELDVEWVEADNEDEITSEHDRAQTSSKDNHEQSDKGKDRELSVDDQDPLSLTSSSSLPLAGPSSASSKQLIRRVVTSLVNRSSSSSSRSSPPPSSPSSSSRATPTTSPTTPRPLLVARPSRPTIPELMQVCHTFLASLAHGTAPWVVQRLNLTYGPAPADPAAFSFYVACVLPIDDAEKARLLPMRSVRLRLRLVVSWIEQLRANWWFDRGCVIL